MDESLLVNARLRVERNRVIHIHRTLPKIENEIFISQGQEVTPADILGEGQAAAGFRTISLSHELKIHPSKVFDCLRRDIGQTIYRGELLAENEGFLGFGKILYPSPVDGIIEFFDENQGSLRIKLLNKKVKLASGVYGIVDHIDKALGTVTIRTLASLVYGILGSGRERDGIVQVLGPSEQLVSARQITDDMRGQIIVGGGLVFADALEKAVNLGVAGVVTGGVNAGDYKAMTGGSWNVHKKQWSDVGVAIVVTEGFGSIPIGEDIFGLLRVHQDKFAVIDGNGARLILPSDSSDSMMYTRKTRLPVKGQVEVNPEPVLASLKVKDRVRIVAGNLIGKQGAVVSIDKTPTKLESGISTIMVTVELRSGRSKIPYSNLEILG